MSQKMIELQEKIQELTGQDVQNRGQMFLLKLAENNGKMKDGRLLIEIPMTHQDIANAIGTTRETVNRMLNQLRKEGIVATDRMGFVIHDLEALQHWRGH
jgi:CRP/FNR family transcriptional regulator